MEEIGAAKTEVVADAGPLAAGAGATSFVQRAVLRRRLRFLQRRREVALHDLGGFVFESHRLETSRPDLEAEKLAALDAIDRELETLQRALEVREEVAVLREPGISACPECHTLHDSSARFCPGCGRSIAGRPA